MGDQLVTQKQTTLYCPRCGEPAIERNSSRFGVYLVCSQQASLQCGWSTLTLEGVMERALGQPLELEK